MLLLLRGARADGAARPPRGSLRRSQAGAATRLARRHAGVRSCCFLPSTRPKETCCTAGEMTGASGSEGILPK